MVAIHLPPPARTPRPLFHTVPTGTHLVRIFDPTDHGTTAVSFRTYGPLRRFDHHRAFGGKPANDPARGIYYAAFSLQSCIVEVFGDTGLIECAQKYVCLPTVTRDLQLLDLRNNGAMRAGSVAALSQNADYAPSQAWSRYFYDQTDVYTPVDGIMYLNAHNREEVIALYERSAASLHSSEDQIIRLDDPALRPRILAIAEQTHLIPPS